MSDNQHTAQPVSIRPAEPRDAEALLAYIEKVAGESDNLTFGPGDFGLTLEQETQFLADAAQRSNSLYLVAEVNGMIVGNLTFTAGRRPRIAHTGELGITVARDWWGQGIATRMIRELIRWSRAHGIRKINLKVRLDNRPAIALYEKLGFETEGVITRDLRIGDEFFDVRQMGLRID